MLRNKGSNFTRLMTIKEEEDSYLRTSGRSNSLRQDSSSSFRGSAEFGKGDMKIILDANGKSPSKFLRLSHSSKYGLETLKEIERSHNSAA